MELNSKVKLYLMCTI